MKKAKHTGGLAARLRKGPLWQFLGKGDGSFILPDPDFITGLYFPLFNLAGMKSYTTPELKGDIARDFHHFLTIPQVTEDFHLSRASRNFWVTVRGKTPWSVAGGSAFQTAAKWKNPEKAWVEAGTGFFEMQRISSELGLSAKTILFVPENSDMVEIMMVEITNVAKKPVTFTATSASPLFGRSADNLRDHRQVTSIFNEVRTLKQGVVLQPRIVHDEHGHRKNSTLYATLAWDESGRAPQRVWSNLADFIGEGGSLDNPEAVYKNNAGTPVASQIQDGVESVAAMRFAPVALRPGAQKTFIVLRGISDQGLDIARWIKTYRNRAQVELLLSETKNFWKDRLDRIRFQTADSAADEWLRWVAFQPFCRKVYGNSYLPDHDYGRGGRGWRDLWSDLAALYLVDPSNTKSDIINNLQGIRIDGTNATIIGSNPGEFVADRNNIARVWSDHGVWPFFILYFYIQQTGDLAILDESIPYWKDAITHRAAQRDTQWNAAQGNWLKNQKGEVVNASLFEHVLVQQLSSFFNVGEHNNLKLEGADWNDTYDMARERGESVCFFNWVAWNLKLLAGLCRKKKDAGKSTLPLNVEILTLLDRLPDQPAVDYSSVAAKTQRLREYCDQVAHQISGRMVAVNLEALAQDLEQKADWIYAHIRKNEWIKTKSGLEFFNGHYDNSGRRMHGDHPNGIRIDLTSQVMAILSGTATAEEIKKTYAAVRKLLRNSKTGGLRLASDLKELKLDWGRVSGFVYGFRENGSIWSQQNAMLIYGLYAQGFVREGYQVYQELKDLALRSDVARTFPNLPSCFRLDGKGMSSYLTGSATWLILALVTQIFGVRGEFGNLRLNPKLTKDQFAADGTAQITTFFQDKTFSICYKNPQGLDWDLYRIAAIKLNGEELAEATDTQGGKIPQSILQKLSATQVHQIEVILDALN